MCTCISMESKEKNYYISRTQEFNLEFDYALITFPRGYNIAKSIEPWKTKYAVLAVGAKGFDMAIDGVNEHGLGAVTQYFAENNRYATCEEIKSANKMPIYAEEAILWFLANCKDTYEVEEKAKEVAIAEKALLLKDMGLPQHFMFQDKSGRCIVVEPSVKNGFQIFENKLGVMTNNPTFDWHITNLKNYTGISDVNRPDANLSGLDVTCIGKGSGLSGIPGDYTSPSRFIRSAYLKAFADKPSDENAVNTIFHLLSMSDITKGVVKTDIGPQYTQYTSVYDLKTKTAYIKMYSNLNIQSISLKDEDMDKDTCTFYKIELEQPITLMKQM